MREMQSRLFSYVITHDSGFAPNPYGGVLTLATCKPRIRSVARSGDWIMGTGSARAVGTGRVVYAGVVSEVLPLEEYASDSRFGVKEPAATEEEWRRHGDNIYSRLRGRTWRQRRNFHHTLVHMPRDLGGKNVLICERFWYFGSSAPVLPAALSVLVKKGPGHRCENSPRLISAFVAWLGGFQAGVCGSPFVEGRTVTNRAR